MKGICTFTSRFTGQRCMAIVVPSSANVKTGDMAQAYFMPTREDPVAARRSGCDEDCCGGCRWRHGGGCYVRVEQGPLMVWKSMLKGRYHEELPISSRPLRLGAWGDPASMYEDDFMRWIALLAGAHQMNKWTGYTHDWRNAGWLREICMASVTREDRDEARDKGWSTFMVVPEEAWDAVPDGERCPNVTRKVKCVNCLRCGPRSGVRRDIVVPAHGVRRKKLWQSGPKRMRGGWRSWTL